MRTRLSIAAVSLFGLVHCGPTLPVKATLVNCADKTPIAGAQFDRMGSVSRSHEDGTWEANTIGQGDYAVEVHKTGFKEQKFHLKPGEQGQTICMTPESK